MRSRRLRLPVAALWWRERFRNRQQVAAETQLGGWKSWIPGHVFWTWFAGAALIAAGVAMIVRVKARLAATLLGAMLLIWVLILHIPRAMADPYSGVGGEWTSVFEALAASGVAFILGQTLAERSNQSR